MRAFDFWPDAASDGERYVVRFSDGSTRRIDSEAAAEELVRQAMHEQMPAEAELTLGPGEYGGYDAWVDCPNGLRARIDEPATTETLAFLGVAKIITKFVPEYWAQPRQTKTPRSKAARKMPDLPKCPYCGRLGWDITENWFVTITRTVRGTEANPFGSEADIDHGLHPNDPIQARCADCEHELAEGSDDYDVLYRWVSEFSRGPFGEEQKRAD